MSGWAVQYLAGGVRRGLGWRAWILALMGPIVLACTQTSFEPRKAPPEQRSYETSQTATTAPANQLVFLPDPASRVELQGTMSLGPWTSQSAEIHGRVALNTDAKMLDALFDRIQSAVPDGQNRLPTDLPAFAVHNPTIADISVPVMSLHGDSGGMDRDMQKALKAQEHPAIEYAFEKLQRAELHWDSHNHQANLKLLVIGDLSMAGVKRPIAMDVIVRRDSHRHFLAHAQTALLMTDYGVTPPTALFGLIKAGNQVVVVFDLDLSPLDQ